MDGEGKSVHMETSYLGAVKQTPYLIRSLKKFMPALKISFPYFDGQDIHILKNDLNYEGIGLDNLIFGKANERGLGICFPTDNKEIIRIIPGSSNISDLSFCIDPLKFEKRRLLGKDEIKEMKEKYKIGDGKIFIAGSFGERELGKIVSPLNKLLTSTKKSKAIIVPRGYNDISLAELRELGLGFETDCEKITGNSQYLFIGEKGVLSKLYSFCDVAFIGDTFKSGEWGQNPLEPAFYGKRILAGRFPRDWNLAAYEGLEKSGLLKIVGISNKSFEEDFYYAISHDDPPKEFKEHQEKAYNFIESMQGAGDVYAEIVQKVLYGKLNSGEVDFLRDKHSFLEIREKFSQ